MLSASPLAWPLCSYKNPFQRDCFRVDLWPPHAISYYLHAGVDLLSSLPDYVCCVFAVSVDPPPFWRDRR